MQHNVQQQSLQPLNQSGSHPPSTPLPMSDQPKHSNVFIRGLPLQLTEEGLRSIFAQYGSVETCRLVIDLHTGASRGYGFVNLQTVGQAEAAIAALNGSVLGERPLEVRLADTEPSNKFTGQQPSNNLYLRNLPLTVREAELTTLFAPYGTVLEKRVLQPVEGARGAGALVRLASAEEAARAIEGLHNRLPLGAALPLLIRYADTPEEKARKMAKRDRNGVPIQHVQTAQAGFSGGQPMQRPSGGPFPTQNPAQQMQSGFNAYPSGQQMPSALGAFPIVQQQQQQQQQQPLLLEGQPQLATAGFFQGANQAGMSGFQSQPAASDFSGLPGGSIPGLTAIKQEPDFSGFGNTSMPGSAGMNGPFMPGPSAAGPAGVGGVNGSFMPGLNPSGGTTPYMQGFGGPQTAMGPMGAAPNMQSPTFGSLMQMGMQQQQQRMPQQLPQQQQQMGPSSSLYVKNLPLETDKLFLYEQFAPHGAILGVKVLTAPDTGKCKGVGFVNYASADSALTAINAVHGTKIGDKVLHVSMQTHRGQRS
ncbi:hypothetical protein WJX84_003794 [Apatococcus fuscideae]|uniref:RRM domain-containing protein n=1 Tax=Apatococcus fuscideae TaxID=2026836 RepID=A0AAW1TB81_9CHLO